MDRGSCGEGSAVCDFHAAVLLAGDGLRKVIVAFEDADLTGEGALAAAEAFWGREGELELAVLGKILLVLFAPLDGGLLGEDLLELGDGRDFCGMHVFADAPDSPLLSPPSAALLCNGGAFLPEV